MTLETGIRESGLEEVREAYLESRRGYIEGRGSLISLIKNTLIFFILHPREYFQTFCSEEDRLYKKVRGENVRSR